MEQLSTDPFHGPIGLLVGRRMERRLSSPAYRGGNRNLWIMPADGRPGSDNLPSHIFIKICGQPGRLMVKQITFYLDPEVAETPIWTIPF